MIYNHWDIFSDKGNFVTHVNLAQATSSRTALAVTTLADQVKSGRVCHYSYFLERGCSHCCLLAGSVPGSTQQYFCAENNGCFFCGVRHQCHVLLNALKRPRLVSVVLYLLMQ